MTVDAMLQLGRLTRMDPREVWGSEAGQFTPWLAQEDNLRLLGDTIGLELELEAQEQNVGPFRADLLCRDVATSAWVLIENQLERTDHTHLGQLITYAAGLKAVTIVWIANPFTEEHRAALDWLNEITDSRFNFFGLEIELWRIGDSPIAPKFNLVSKPNDWSKIIVERTAHVELTDAKELQLSFWTAFRDFVARQHTPIRATKPLPQNWMNIAIGRSGFGLAAVASLWDSVAESYETNEVRAEFTLTGAQAKAYLTVLEADKVAIETEIGQPLLWHNPADTRSARIYVRRTANLRDRNSWPELHAWLLKRLEEFRSAFAKRVKMLTLPMPG
jgi:Domain of unknown function (DUF4268)